MKTTRAALAIFLFLVLSGISAVLPAASRGDSDKQVQQKVLDAIRSGNSAEVAQYLNTMADLDLPGYRGTYSKAQAAKILQDYFLGHRITSVVVTSSGTSGDGSFYTIADLKSGGKTSRLYFVIRDSDGKRLVCIFKINDP